MVPVSSVAILVGRMGSGRYLNIVNQFTASGRPYGIIANRLDDPQRGFARDQHLHHILGRHPHVESAQRIDPLRIEVLRCGVPLSRNR